MKPKILFILHWPPPVHGSAVVGLQIRESGIINDVLDGKYINLSTSKSIDEIGKNAIPKVFRYSAIVLKVFWNLLTNRPNLCYFAITVNGIAFYKDTFIVLLIKLFRVKLVYHLHNKGISTKKDNFFDNLLYKSIFKNSKVILLSQYLYKDIRYYISPADVYICPNGIPENKIRQKQYTNNETVKILFLSNLIESKGVYVLLVACSILKQNGIAFQCDFIGGEGDINTNRFNEKVKHLGLTSQVSYLGKKYGEEKNKAFAEADIFAFPTHYHNECFPLVLLEAMQHFLPVISTFEGGIPDIVEDGKTGFLIPRKNAEALAEKLEILIKNPNLRKQMGNAGYKKYNQKFTSTHFELRFKEIITELIN